MTIGLAQLTPATFALAIAIQVTANDVTLSEHHLQLVQNLFFRLVTQQCSKLSGINDLVGRISRLSTAPDVKSFCESITQQVAQITTVDDIYSTAEDIKEKWSKEMAVPESIDEEQRDSAPGDTTFGIFCRGICLQIKSLAFQQICNFLSALQREVDDTSIDGENGMSRDAADEFINNACNPSVEDATTLSPYAMQLVAQNIWLQMPDQVKAHYVTFQNCMATAEYDGALASLHRYFDYAAAHASKDPSAKRSMFQYALLDLANLHHKFGNRDDALLAIREAITVARSNGDLQCLHAALTLLHNLSGGLSPMKEGSSSLRKLAELEHDLNIGTEPSVVLEVMQRHRNSETIDSKMDGATNTEYHQTAVNVWNLYGESELAQLHADILIDGTRCNDAETGLLAYCTRAEMYARRGQVAKALEILQYFSTHNRKYSFTSQKLIFCRAKILFDSAIREERLLDAEFILERVAFLSESKDFLTDISLMEALLHCKFDRTPAATVSLARRWHEAQNDSREGFDINSLTLLAGLVNVLMEYGNERQALPHLLLALDQAERLHAASIQHRLLGHLAKWMITFESPHRAKHLLEQVMPQVLASDSTYTQNKLRFTYAECLIAIHQDSKVAMVSDDDSEVMLHLQKSYEGFEQISALTDMMQVKKTLAKWHNSRGRIRERDMISADYRQLYNLRDERRGKLASDILNMV